jgi:hypothetical protein
MDFNQSLSLNDSFLSKSRIKEIDYSENFLELIKLISLFGASIVTIIGLIGHSLIIIVFCHKRFRTNSSCVFLIFLSINDLMFLIINFFEETFKGLNENYNILPKDLRILNLTDNFESACILINYLQYVLKFSSSYILIVFTLCRMLIISYPISTKFKSKKAARNICIGVIFLAILINFWSLFIFEIDFDLKSNNYFCNVKKQLEHEYYILTFVFIILTLVIPVIIILSSNSILIKNIRKSNRLRKILNQNIIKTKTQETKLQSIIPTPTPVISKAHLSTISHNTVNSSPRNSTKREFKVKPYYAPVNQSIGNNNNNSKSSMDSSKNLILISFLFVALNLPYLTLSVIYDYYIYSGSEDIVTNNYILSWLILSEILYLLNFSILFYAYCYSGANFRNQLKFTSNHFEIFI